MFNIIWALLMVSAFVAAGVYINKTAQRKRKKKRA